jgi:hypothetical protein
MAQKPPHVPMFSRAICGLTIINGEITVEGQPEYPADLRSFAVVVRIAV